MLKTLKRNGTGFLPDMEMTGFLNKFFILDFLSEMPLTFLRERYFF